MVFGLVEVLLVVREVTGVQGGSWPFNLRRRSEVFVLDGSAGSRALTNLRGRKQRRGYGASGFGRSAVRWIVVVVEEVLQLSERTAKISIVLPFDESYDRRMTAAPLLMACENTRSTATGEIEGCR